MMRHPIRQYREIAIIADVRFRDMKSERDWIVGIVATALIIGTAAILSALG
jgi:hypothetical protein